MDAPPASSTKTRFVTLVLRILTLIFLVIALIIITTVTAKVENIYGVQKFHFKDVYSYRYMLATIVFGLAYTLLQVAFNLYYVVTGNRLSGGILFDFYGDKVMSYVLATGTAAGFAASKDLKNAYAGSGSQVDNFFNQGFASSSILLFAFLFTAILSIFSSYALSKKV